MNAPKPRDSILDIAPYVAGKATAKGVQRAVKLSANENALGASPAAIAAYRAASDELHLYPDPAAATLRALIAAKHALAPEQIVFGTGSDELFSMACIAFLEPGDNMVQPRHGFAAWSIAARAVGGEVKNAEERAYTADVDALLAAVDERTRIVFLANPANPTGTFIPFSEVERLHAGLRPDILLVLDEAYVEFARGVLDTTQGLKLAARTANVLTTRTFSKLHGLAALRIGWGYAAPAIAEAINRFRLPFNTARPAQRAAEAAMCDDDFIERSIAYAEGGREHLAEMLRGFGLEPIPTATNFVTAHVGPDVGMSAKELEQALSAQGVLVRGLAGYSMPDHLRVTVGAPDDMMRLHDALTTVLRA